MQSGEPEITAAVSVSKVKAASHQILDILGETLDDRRGAGDHEGGSFIPTTSIVGTRRDGRVGPIAVVAPLPRVPSIGVVSLESCQRDPP